MTQRESTTRQPAVPSAKPDPAARIQPGRYNIYDHIETFPGGREELMEEVSPDFPYNPVRSEHDRYANRFVPWHWHQELELFFCEQGEVVYEVPHDSAAVRPGDVGLVNANVLHSTHAASESSAANLKIHMFRPSFLAEPGSRAYRSCVEPLVDATSVGLLVVRADERGGELSRAVARSFETFERGGRGWELRLRDQLSELWLDFVDIAGDRVGNGPAAMPRAAEERLKAMLDFVGNHYFEGIGVADIAEAGFASERECYRTFQEELGTTPAGYLRKYRVEQACRMLAHTTRPIAAVAQMSGLGTASHFGQAFKAAMGLTPREYRARWQNRDSLRQRAE